MACSEQIAQPMKLVSFFDKEVAKEVFETRMTCKNEGFTASCMEDYLSPNIKAFPIYESPESAQPSGTFLVSYSPDYIVDIKYYSVGSQTINAVELDLFLPDLFYGPYFHKALIDSKDGWYKFAVPDSSMKFGWVKLSNPEVMSYDKGEIVEFEKKSYVILDIDKEYVSVRSEQEADMWCQAGNPPALAESYTMKISIESLYDDECRLKMRPTNLKGC